jgi:hypothetical protein
MLTRLVIVLITVSVLAVTSGPLCYAQEFYYDLDSMFALVRSSSKIAVQFEMTCSCATDFSQWVLPRGITDQGQWHTCSNEDR